MTSNRNLLESGDNRLPDANACRNDTIPFGVAVSRSSQSDSTASDVLFARLEGAIGIREFLARHGIEGIRVDRDERHLQTDILGLNWRPDYVEATVLARARKALPERVRDAAFDAYVKDGPDDKITNRCLNLPSIYFNLFGKRLDVEAQVFHAYRDRIVDPPAPAVN